MAREILAQAPERGTELERERKDGSRYSLDLSALARNAAARMGDCGTFPRGRVSLHWKDGSQLDLGSHQCNHRLCPRCGKRRGFRLSADMTGALKMIEAWGWRADRTRFATLTIENTESADEGVSRIMEAWHRTLATKTWGRLIAGGFRAVEIKPGKNGRWNVHLHAILYLWTPAIPYKLIREAWNRAAGGNYNQRFDALRNKARAMPGESKASAAARYLVKYLVKHEEIAGTRRMPGGLPHMLGAIEGRRLFGAWGLGAAALRIERAERPNWTAQYDRHISGYSHNGTTPERAELHTPWGTREPITIPLPSLPSAFDREEIPDQIEPKGGKWTVRNVRVSNPLGIHPWQRIPTAMRSARGMESALEAWIQNPRSRGPKPFRWRSWYAEAAKEWTGEAGVLLGERTIAPNLGAALWSRVQAPGDRFPDPGHPEHFARQMIASHAQALREGRRGLHGCCTDGERIAYLARMPEQIRIHLEDICRENQQVRGWFPPPPRHALPPPSLQPSPTQTGLPLPFLWTGEN